jgi:hypothetical protein
MKAFKGPKYQKGFLALAVTALSTVASLRSGRKATKAGKRANEAQKKINRAKNRQAKRAFLKNFRANQAATIQGAATAGVDIESSAFQGNLASARTQKNLALQEFVEFDKLGAEVSDAQQGQATHNARSAAFGQVASFASNFVDFGAIRDKFKFL